MAEGGYGMPAGRAGSPAAALKFHSTRHAYPCYARRMLRRFLSKRFMIPVILCVQIVPLLLFPASSYTLTSQEWWLPAVLTVLAVVALVQILVRRSTSPAPWYILSFAQGINIISRLMMLMPRSTAFVGGVQRFNTQYVVLTLVAMVLSALEIWYGDLPEVRKGLLA